MIIGLMVGGPHDGDLHGIVQAGTEKTFPLDGTLESLYELAGSDVQGRLLYVYRGARARVGAERTLSETVNRIAADVHS